MKSQALEFAQATAYRMQRSARRPHNGVIPEEDEEYENDRSTYMAGSQSLLYNRTPRESERSQKLQKPSKPNKKEEDDQDPNLLRARGSERIKVKKIEFGQKRKPEKLQARFEEKSGVGKTKDYSTFGFQNSRHIPKLNFDQSNSGQY